MWLKQIGNGRLYNPVEDGGEGGPFEALLAVESGLNFTRFKAGEGHDMITCSKPSWLLVKGGLEGSGQRQKSWEEASGG